MKLSRKDYEFNNTKICHVTPKHLELDRVLINLYMLVKYDGRRPVARKSTGPICGGSYSACTHTVKIG